MGYATYEIVTECAYCAMDVPAGPVPTVSDDDAWEDLAQHHGAGCEWIATRAFRWDLPGLATLLEEEKERVALALIDKET